MVNFEKAVIKTYNLLRTESDLSPRNDTVNKLLGNLVTHANQCTICDEPCIFSNKAMRILPQFRLICAKAESEMEIFWAQKFIEKNSLTYDDLQEFWYWHNYRYIAEKELSLIHYYFPADKKIKLLFAGSGPLPLSAIILQQTGNFDITLLDINQEAVELSRRLSDKLSMSFKIIKGDINSFPVGGYDLVFIASLVPDKSKVVEHLRNSGVKYYMTRGVDGVYGAFYEDLPQDIKSSAEHIYKPSDALTLNSSYIFRIA